MMKGKNIIEHMTEGRIKLIYKADNGVIIGASIIGNSATELIHELALAINNGLTIDNLKNTVHAHPTISEVIWNAALNGQPFDSTEDFMASTPH